MWCASGFGLSQEESEPVPGYNHYQDESEPARGYTWVADHGCVPNPTSCVPNHDHGCVPNHAIETTCPVPGYIWGWCSLLLLKKSNHRKGRHCKLFDMMRGCCTLQYELVSWFVYPLLPQNADLAVELDISRFLKKYSLCPSPLLDWPVLLLPPDRLCLASRLRKLLRYCLKCLHQDHWDWAIRLCRQAVGSTKRGALWQDSGDM